MEKCFFHETNPVKTIPTLSQTEISNGVQYGHIMIKPEALEKINEDPETKDAFLTKLYSYFDQLNLEIVSTVEDKLDISIFQVIYRREIEAGIIPDWEVRRFSESNTLSFILKGVDAMAKTTFIKGKFSCDKSDCFYRKTGTEIYKNDSECIDITGWGSGCGIRGFIARKNLVQPDIGEIDYTVYNWIHSPDQDQDFAVNIIIDFINNHSST